MDLVVMRTVAFGVVRQVLGLIGLAARRTPRMSTRSPTPSAAIERKARPPSPSTLHPAPPQAQTWTERRAAVEPRSRNCRMPCAQPEAGTALATADQRF